MAETEQEQKSFQWRWLILTVAIVVSLIFLIPFIQEGGARVDTNVIVETEQAFVGAIRETTTGKGEVIEPVSQPVKTKYDGIIAQVMVQEGDQVYPGDQVVRLDEAELEEQVIQLLDELDELDEQISQADEGGSTYLLSGANGTVKAIYAQRGDRSDDLMESWGALLEISTDGLLQVELALAEGAELEDSVTVLVGGKEEEGTVAAIDEEQQRMTVTFPDQEEYALGTQVIVMEDETELGRGAVASYQPWRLTAESGIISEIEVEVGDQVHAGDALVRCVMAEQNEAYLALLDQRGELVERLFALQEFAKDPVICADFEGVIQDLDLEAGSSISADSQICRVSSVKQFYGQVSVLKEDAQRVCSGQRIELVIGDQTYEGKVLCTALSSEMMCSLEVIPVRILLEDGEGLDVGMTGGCTVILASEEEAVLVPAAAVKVQEDGTKAVEISYGDGLNRFNKVETGLEDGSYVQILKGVDEGENVVVASRVVEKKVVEFLGHEWVVEETEE